jgi:hypothetical protein
MAKKDFKAGLGSIIPDQAETKKSGKAKAAPAPAKRTKPKYKKHPFTVSEEQLEKIRFIADTEPGKLKAVVFNAFKAEIDKYEKKNGKIEL